MTGSADQINQSTGTLQVGDRSTNDIHSSGTTDGKKWTASGVYAGTTFVFGTGAGTSDFDPEVTGNIPFFVKSSNGGLFVGFTDQSHVDGSTGIPDLSTQNFNGSFSIDGTFASLGLFDTVPTALPTPLWTATTGTGSISLAAIPEPSTGPAITSKNPADGATDVAIDANLVATFDENIALTGGGTITISDLGSEPDVVITLPDNQVSVSGAVLTINPTDDLLPGNSYAVQISADAVEDLATNPFAGILNDTAWNFDTAVAGVTVVNIGIYAHSYEDGGEGFGNSDWNTCLTLDANGNAYAVFVDSNKKNTVAKVTPGGVVTTQIIDMTDNDDDKHNTPSIAIDGDGILHVAYNMHHDPMRMRKSPTAYSVAGVWTDEGASMPGDFTYPAMSTAPNGDVYMTVRRTVGLSANLFHYDNTTDSWSSIAEFAQEDGYWAYLPAPYVALDGKVHLEWHWNKDNSGGKRQLGSYVVYDPDPEPGDPIWSKANGTEYTIPITPTTSDLYQPSETDWGGWGISDTSITVNALGQPILAYNFFREGDFDQRVVRLARWDGTEWQRTDLDGPATGTTLGDPVIVNRDGDLHIYYNDAEGKLTLISSFDDGLTFGDAITLTDHAVKAPHVLIGTSIGENKEAIHFLDTTENYAAKVMFVDYAQVGGPFIPGDADGDGDVNITDGGILVSHFGHDGTQGHDETWFTGDFNNDGVVNITDGGILVANFGNSAPDTAGVDGDAQWTFDAVVVGLSTTITVDAVNMAFLSTEALDGATLEMPIGAVGFSSQANGSAAQVGEFVAGNFITGTETISITVPEFGIYEFETRWNVLGGTEQSETFFIEFTAIPEPSTFAITAIDYSPDADPNPTVTLTWRSRPGTTYKAFATLDLSDWSNELANSLGADADENTDDGARITVTFPLTDGLEDEPNVSFCIQEEIKQE